jgi:DNA polymerase delta subunit 4
MSTLKQGTLSFTSTKRTSSNPTAKFKSKSNKGYRESYARSVSVGSVSVSSAATSEPETVTDGGQVVNNEVEEEIHVQPPMKKLRLDDSKGKARPLSTTSQSKSPGKKRKEGLDMEDESGKWRKHWGVVREKMGYMEPSGCIYALLSPATGV